MSLQESGEMYLEAIYVLSKNSDSVRGIDIGEYLGYSKPSVSRALGLLKDEGMILKDENGFIILTEKGAAHAARIYERHTVLKKLFMDIGVDEETATEDACRIEHYISDKTFEAVKASIKKADEKKKATKKNPR
ncbi:MAG: metal-dependent transcriptional regulator [Lachnospiraceae bacterium]|nr:metal-dependent transcriptional regulator [Lachnospiraceae bacterium]MBP5183604.1 metal-dependent transcriptional regulator [Lachnospiraceae bacterium]